MHKVLTSRYFFLIIACVSAFLVLGSYFIENFLTIEPCVLCAMQRILLTWILGTAIAGFLLDMVFTSLFLKNFFTNLIYNIIDWFCLLNILLCNLSGVLISGRQTWLQYFVTDKPHQVVSSCTAGLDQLIMQHPIATLFDTVINGNLSCSDVHFSLMGLSLANWSLISFLVLFGFNVAVIYRKLKY